MITVKRAEIRDKGTTISAVALLMEGDSDDPLLRRAGFVGPMVVLVHLEHMQCAWDPFDWLDSGNRTMHQAHLWLQDHWDEHEDSGVVCVEYILGERGAPKAKEVT